MAAATPPTPSALSIAHSLLVDLESSAPVVFGLIVTALTSGTPLVGPLAPLEQYREDLQAAYTVFTKVQAFVTAMSAIK